MKKLLLSLMTVTVVGTSATTVVACGGNKFNNEIYLITDSGKTDDKSFNESSYKAASTFSREILGVDKDAAYIQPSEASLNLLTKAYKSAKKNGAKSLVLPGFHHTYEGANEAPGIMEGQGSTVLLDSSNGGKTNQVAFSFRGDVSGFYAGMAAIVVSINEGNTQKVGEVDTVSLGSFGGVTNSGSVDNFIVGYLASAEVFNAIKTDESVLRSIGIKTEKLTEAKSVNATKSQKAWPGSNSDTSWFSNSFLIGQAKTVLGDLINSSKSVKPNVVMAVAGPQTDDAIAFDKDWKMVGVDIDQAQSFTEASKANRFITSAEKDLYNSAIVGLAHTPEWKDVKVTDGTTEETVAAKADRLYNKTPGKFLVEKDGKYEKIEDVVKDGDWTGQDVWVNGQASYTDGNLLTKDIYEGIQKEFTPDELTNASIDLFATINNVANGYISNDGTKVTKTIINEPVVKAYANKIMTGTTNPEETKKDLAALIPNTTSVEVAKDADQAAVKTTIETKLTISKDDVVITIAEGSKSATIMPVENSTKYSGTATIAVTVKAK